MHSACRFKARCEPATPKSRTMQKFALKLLLTSLVVRRRSKRIDGAQLAASLVTLVVIVSVGFMCGRTVHTDVQVPDSPERIRRRHPAPRVMHWPFLSDQRNLSGRSARASVCGTRNTRTSIYSRRNVVHWAHPQQRESGARHLGMATHKLPSSRPAVVSENARIAPPTLLPLTAPARSRRSCPGRCPPYAAHRKRLRRQPQSGQVCRYAQPRLVEGRTRQLLERQPGLRSQRRRHRRHRLPAQRSRRSGVVDRALREGADQQSRGPGAAVGPGPVSSALPGWRRR